MKLKLRTSFGEMELSEDLRLSLNGKPLEYQSRRLRDLNGALLDPAVADSMPGDTILYNMFRDAAKEEHKAVFRSRKVRFDITVMSAAPLGEELNKTLGHYHPVAVDGLSYPEIYQVLHGNAYYLLQKGSPPQEFTVVDARAGDAVLIPPNYGHVTVNVGESPLVMANLVSDAFSSLYEEYLERRGAAYYVLKGRRLVRNPRYGGAPEPRLSSAGYPVSKDIYSDFLCCPSSFAFLNDPRALSHVPESGKILSCPGFTLVSEDSNHE